MASLILLKMLMGVISVEPVRQLPLPSANRAGTGRNNDARTISAFRWPRQEWNLLHDMS